MYLDPFLCTVDKWGPLVSSSWLEITGIMLHCVIYHNQNTFIKMDSQGYSNKKYFISPILRGKLHSCLTLPKRIENRLLRHPLFGQIIACFVSCWGCTDYNDSFTCRPTAPVLLFYFPDNASDILQKPKLNVCGVRPVIIATDAKNKNNRLAVLVKCC